MTHKKKKRSSGELPRISDFAEIAWLCRKAHSRGLGIPPTSARGGVAGLWAQDASLADFSIELHALSDFLVVPFRVRVNHCYN